MDTEKIVYINDRPVVWEGETNILALARKAHVEIPTFCYHSELSVYGACRLCLVEVEGRGLVTSCSTAPFEGMRVKTRTQQILKLRKLIIEMLLANHDRECTQCDRSPDCKLREISYKLGVDKIRFRKTRPTKEIDTGSPCLVRDPNKCVLCGDCVRFCSEVQGIGAIDFANRGEGVVVTPAYGKSLAKVDCVHCGQCAAVCPTGALTIRSQTDQVWNQLQDPGKKVVVQIAPAVRVALGEMFNLPAGEITTGKMIAALRMMGFDRVFDTSFAADLTVIEEANEFLKRKTEGGKLPIFTSCCPAWVKFAEQSYPKLLPHLSSCRSPQQMFGSIAKNKLRSCYIRPLVWRGYHQLGVEPRTCPVQVMVAVWDWGAYLGADALEHGVDGLSIRHRLPADRPLRCSGCLRGEPPAGKRREADICLLYTSPSPRDRTRSRMPSSA